MSLVLAGDVADARIQVMAGNVECSSDRRASRLRAIAWGTAAIMLLLPVFAMQVTDEVDWDAADFVVFGAMLVAAGGAYELAVRVTSNKAYRAAFAVALMAAFILVWLNLAVGIIGSEENPANLMYGAVLAVGLLGASIARFRPRGMARALVATALAQASVAVIVLTTGLGVSGRLGVGSILTLNGLFVTLWLGAAWLFRHAAAAEPCVAARPED
jgi:hypothetical protein